MSFGDEVREWTLEAFGDTNIVLRKLGLDILAGVVKKTPVDEGYARANWYASIDAPSTEKNMGDKSSAESVVSREAKVFDSIDARKATAFYITNNVEYIGVLEYGGYPNPVKRGSWVKSGGKGEWVIKSSGGYSKQAPRGMVRITLAEVDEMMRKAVNSVK